MKDNNGFQILSNQDETKRCFIAGQGNGIVTVDGKPASKRILLFERSHMFPCIRQIWSAADGTYLFGGLESNKLYLVMAVDDKEKYEPVAWDFIKAAQPDAQPLCAKSVALTVV